MADLGTLEKVTLKGAGNISAGGDINGDGVADQLVGLPSGNEAGRERSGSVYVVFGNASAGHRDLEELGTGGFLIHGGHQSDGASQAAGVGDVNGDGLGDVLVGAPLGRTTEDGSATGAAYVVFGKTSNDSVDLLDFDESRQGDSGDRISGGSSFSLTGSDVGAPGDVNGDGLADLLIGAPFAGAAYVVFGQRSTQPVDLLTFDLGAQGPTGYRISTPVPETSDLFTVSGAGDVNGDGIPDTLVGVLPKHSSRGSTYAIYGKNDPLEVRTGELTPLQGFEIRGPRRGSSAGYALAPLSDLNEDGFDDIAVGAPSFECCRSGKVFVLFGRATSDDVMLKRLGKRGYLITGGLVGSVGLSVSGLNDLNGDGLPEVLVGSPYDSRKYKAGNGFAYVVFGQSKRQRIRLAKLGGRGIRIEGERKSDQLGGTLGDAGDVDADGISDLLIGCFGRTKAYVVWGSSLAGRP